MNHKKSISCIKATNPSSVDLDWTLLLDPGGNVKRVDLAGPMQLRDTHGVMIIIVENEQ